MNRTTRNDEVRKMRNQGIPINEIANKLKITVSTVYRITAFKKNMSRADTLEAQGLKGSWRPSVKLGEVLRIQTFNDAGHCKKVENWTVVSIHPHHVSCTNGIWSQSFTWWDVWKYAKGKGEVA